MSPIQKNSGTTGWKIVFPVIFLVVLFSALTISCEEFIDSGYRFQDSFSQTFPLKEAGSFSIANINGAITITASPALEVSVKATKYARWRKSDLEKVKIEIAKGEKSVSVETIHEKRNLGVKVDYEIAVPEKMALELIRTVNGKIAVSGKFDRAELKTTNGKIEARGEFGILEAATTNGSLEIVQAKGKISLRTTNGSIRVELDEISADLSARTTNGSISLKVSRQPEGYFNARTVNGSIRVDYPLTVEGQISKRRIEGRLGSGQGSKINLETTNGSISLLKF
jgi:hypothetical protein